MSKLKKASVPLVEIDEMLAGFRARHTALCDVLRLETLDEEGVGTGFVRVEDVSGQARGIAAIIEEMEARFFPPPAEPEAEPEHPFPTAANDTAAGAVPAGSTPGRRGRAWTAEQRAEQANRMRARAAHRKAA